VQVKAQQIESLLLKSYEQTWPLIRTVRRNMRK